MLYGGPTFIELIDIADVNYFIYTIGQTYKMWQAELWLKLPKQIQ
jgi:hypothetical protein